jgi:hypothetical protein
MHKRCITRKADAENGSGEPVDSVNEAPEMRYLLSIGTTAGGILW